ncbi:MAG: hypothetical protein KGD65_12520 [Candidatus Lokiarchaeota archaeon]|nr:hypothetical protein [Candidatus Lokiarchaeota archaeon]
MICDVLIIKDGLPLLSKSFPNSSNGKNMFSELDNLIMVSGFFSALNSFSNSFDSLGYISELKMENSNLKLSFLKDPHVPDIIFLATFDSDSDLKSVQRFLNKIAEEFFEKFDTTQIADWNGKLDSFKTFENIIEKYVNENETVEQTPHDTKAFDWLTSFETDDKIELEEEFESKNPDPEYYDFIPSFIGPTSKSINPKNYLTGDISYKIYEKIDGMKSINQITHELSMEQNKVYNICKNLVKLGFISFN